MDNRSHQQLFDKNTPPSEYCEKQRDGQSDASSNDQFDSSSVVEFPVPSSLEEQPVNDNSWSPASIIGFVKRLSSTLYAKVPRLSSFQKLTLLILCLLFLRLFSHSCSLERLIDELTPGLEGHDVYLSLNDLLELKSQSHYCEVLACICIFTFLASICFTGKLKALNVRLTYHSYNATSRDFRSLPGDMAACFNRVQVFMVNTFRFCSRAVVGSRFPTENGEQDYRPEEEEIFHDLEPPNAITTDWDGNFPVSSAALEEPVENCDQWSFLDEIQGPYSKPVTNEHHDNCCSTSANPRDNFPILNSDAPMAIFNMPNGCSTEGISNSANRTSPLKTVANTSFGDSYATFGINSFKLPDFSVKIPETATVSFIKMAIAVEVNSLFSGGLGINILHQGKKMGDDNEILLCSGVPRNASLDLILESHYSQASPTLCPQAYSGCKAHLSTRPLPIFAENQRVTSNASLNSQITNLGECHTSTSLKNKADDSMDAATPLAINSGAQDRLKHNTFHEQFTVDEVQALVDGVGKLGVGRWMKIKRAYKLLS